MEQLKGTKGQVKMTVEIAAALANAGMAILMLAMAVIFAWLYR